MESREYYDAAATRGSRHVLLFTDGEPGCSGAATGEPCQEASKEVAELSGPTKVRTTVFALKQELAANACLRDLAALGAQGGVLLPSSDEATLRMHLETVLKPLSYEACNFRLSQPLQPGQSIKVTAADKELQRDPTRTEGWEFMEGSMSRFTVYGKWCDMLRAPPVADVDVYLCPAR